MSKIGKYKCKALAMLLHPKVNKQLNKRKIKDKLIMDKFSTRYGYEAGRCNAKRKKHPGKLCRRYPVTGSKRCKLHGAGWIDGIRYSENHKH